MLRLLPLWIALSLASGCGPSTGSRFPPTKAPDLDFPVGPFSLTERDGRTVTDADLRGKVWVASFVFTRCMGPCPAVTGTVRGLQDDLSDLPDVRFVTFTVDPARDDAGELKKYAEKYRADPGRWLFLTGDEKTLHTLMRDRFKLAVGRKEGPEVKPGDEFDHSTRLSVIDKHGIIRASFDGIRNEIVPDGKAAFEQGLTRLKEKVRALAAEN